MVLEGWKELSLGEAILETKLGTTERGASTQASIPLIKMGNLGWGALKLHQVEQIDISKVENDLLLEPGDLLFNTRNTAELVGKTALWQGELSAASFDNNINRFRLKPNYDPYFVTAYMSTGQGKRRIRSVAAGSTSVAAIYWKDISKLRLLVPPLPEQKKIAEILSTWDKAIETTEKLLTNAETQKKALMQELLTGKRRLRGVEEEWRTLRIKDVCAEFSVRNKVDKALPVVSCSKVLGFVNSLEYFNKKVFSDDLTGYKIIRRGQIGYPSNHIEEGSIGIQSLHDEALVSPIYTVFETTSEVDGMFLFRLLKTEAFRQRFAAATNASVDRRGSLRWKAFSEISLRLPSKSEQVAITEVLDAATLQQETMSKQLQMLRHEKKALMQQLLTGKRRVTV